jgi:apolipoprotein N-acyltransferase
MTKSDRPRDLLGSVISSVVAAFVATAISAVANEALWGLGYFVLVPTILAVIFGVLVAPRSKTALALAIGIWMGILISANWHRSHGDDEDTAAFLTYWVLVLAPLVVGFLFVTVATATRIRRGPNDPG